MRALLSAKVNSGLVTFQTVGVGQVWRVGDGCWLLLRADHGPGIAVEDVEGPFWGEAGPCIPAGWRRRRG